MIECDKHTPEMNGLDLVKQLRQNSDSRLIAASLEAT
jgi:CheY-like chemotaxis protein